MPGRQEVTGFTAGRRITLNGATYQPGADVPLAVVRALPRLSALVNRRLLVPAVDPFRRAWQRTVPGPVDAKSLVIEDPAV